MLYNGYKTRKEGEKRWLMRAQADKEQGRDPAYCEKLAQMEREGRWICKWGCGCVFNKRVTWNEHQLLCTHFKSHLFTDAQLEKWRLAQDILFKTLDCRAKNHAKSVAKKRATQKKELIENLIGGIKELTRRRVQAHQITKKKEKEPKVYKCKICSKTYLSRQSLATHTYRASIGKARCFLDCSNLLY